MVHNGKEGKEVTGYYTNSKEVFRSCPRDNYRYKDCSQNSSVRSKKIIRRFLRESKTENGLRFR